jgi:cytochrome b
MPASRSEEPASDGRVLVWDVAVRLLHWLLAALVVFDFIADDGGWLHRMVGYAAVVVVLLRWSWAAITSGHASFAALRPSIAATRDYLHAGAPRHLGHDPLGVWLVWLVWLLVVLLGVTGWMSHLDAFWGDERVRTVHALLADALLASVVLHLAGIAVMSWLWRENLPASMLLGHKRESDLADSR